MPLDHLLAALERDGRERAEAILTEAHDEARRIAEETRRRIDARAEERLRATETETRAQARAEIEDARRAARREVLEARRKLLDRLFLRVEERLGDALSVGGRLGALRQWVDASRATVGGGDAVVRCPPGLARRIREDSSLRDGLTVEEDPSVGPGFILVSADGRVEVDGRLSTRLARLRPALSIEILARIGEAGE